VNAMAAIDAFEIKSLNLALINGSSSTAKKSAGLMVTVQQILTARLKALSGRRSSNLTPGPTLNAEPRGKIAGFNTKLDLVFIDTTLVATRDTMSAMCLFVSPQSPAIMLRRARRSFAQSECPPHL
jgi:hypothetical protein